MAKNTFLVVFILLCSFYHSWGNQFEYQFKNYRFNEGLPSSQVFEILQDQAGYIWFGTDRGLVRYDGYEFKVFTIKDGLSSNVIFKLDEDEFGRICCYSIDRKIHIFDGNRFIEYEYNEILVANISGNAHLLDFDFDQNGFTFSSSEEEQSLAIFGSISTDGCVEIVRSQGIYLSSRANSFIGLKSHSSVDSLFVDGVFKGNLNYPNDNKKYFASSLKAGNIIYFTVDRWFYKITLKDDYCVELIHEFSDEVLDIKMDNNSDIYFGLRNSGLWKMTKEDVNTLTCMLANRSIPDILIDRQKGVWASTLFNGLFYCDNTKNRNLKLSSNELVHRLIKHKDVIYSITNKNNLIAMKYNDSLQLIDESYSYKSSVYYDSDSYIEDGLMLDRKSKSYFYFGLSLKDIFIKPNGLFALGRNFLRIYEDDPNLVLKREIYFNSYINCATPLGDRSILLGTNNGVEILLENAYDQKRGRLEDRFKGDDFTVKFDSENSFFNSKMHSIINQGDSLMYFGSGEKGLLIREKGQFDKYITKKDGLISDAIEKLYVEGEILVVVTKEGISVISNDDEIVNYTWKNGLLSNNVFDVVLQNDKIWVATDLGLSILENKKQFLYEIPISLTEVNLNMERQLLSENYDLSNNQTLLDVSFKGLSYGQEGGINYKYQLKGVDNHWIETPYTKARYANLPYGKFDFIIMAQKRDLSWTKPVQLFHINRLKPFWKTKLFYIILFLLILGAIYAGFSLRFEQLKRVEEDKALMLNLERKTLQAQMHPHFVFNSLTSLQSLIIDDKKFESQEFLAKFSKLTRMALQHSTRNMISLAEEIHMLRLYIDLERIRYQQKFEYNISSELNESEYEISPMLIQPFVENAIKHGFSNTKINGKITISFKKRDSETFLCIVSDNGSGRQVGSIKKNRESLGIRLVNDRLNILLKNVEVEVVQIKDLYKNEVPIGTRIEIILPLKHRVS